MNEFIQKNKVILQVQMKFVAIYLGGLYHIITVLQKQLGGILDVLSVMSELKGKWQAGIRSFDEGLMKLMQRCSADDAKNVARCLVSCLEILVAKMDYTLTKTVKPQSYKAAQFLQAFCPSALQTDKIPSLAAMKECFPIPGIFGTSCHGKAQKSMSKSGNGPGA